MGGLGFRVVPLNLLQVWPLYYRKDLEKGSPKPKGTTLRVQGATPRVNLLSPKGRVRDSPFRAFTVKPPKYLQTLNPPNALNPPNPKP